MAVRASWIVVGIAMILVVHAASAAIGAEQATPSTSSSSPSSGSGSMPLPSRCRLANATLNRFRYLTFYAWHTATGSWCPNGQSSSLEELWEYFNATKRPSLLEIESVFFEDMRVVKPHLQGLTLRSDAFARWDALVNYQGPRVSLTHLVRLGAVTGFFLGDELVWNNITWHQLNATSHAVKQSFPSCFVFYNEGGAPLWGGYNVNRYHVEYPYVPYAVDYVSTDDYDSITMKKGPRWMYESFLYPKINLKRQKVFVIPPVYAWLNKTCDVACWDGIELAQAEGYMAWIDQDERIAGISGFHFSSYPPSDLGLISLPRTLACYKDLAEQMLSG